MKRHGHGTGLGFEMQMRQADFTAFQRWYERRWLLGEVSRAECEASLSAPRELREPQAASDPAMSAMPRVA